MSTHKIQCCQVSDIFCLDLQRFQELFSDGLGRFALMPGIIGLSPTLFVHEVLRPRGYDEVGTALLPVAKRSRRDTKGYMLQLPFSWGECLWEPVKLCMLVLKRHKRKVIFQYRHRSVSISAGTASI